MAWRKSPQALIDLFEHALPADPRIERRKMFGYPAAFVNGRLFTGLHQESFLLKLPEADRERLKAESGATIFEPRAGRRMRDYVVLPQTLISDREALAWWLDRSIGYTAGLENANKPSKRTRLQHSARRRSQNAREQQRASFETAASRPPQDEELSQCHQQSTSS